MISARAISSRPMFISTKAFFFLLLLLVELVRSAPIPRKNKGDSFYSGSGTYFAPTAQGACGGPKESSKSNIVALNSKQYGPMNRKSKQCGRKVLIKHGDKEAVAVVGDACPGCQEKSLDMTPSVFSKLADKKQGVIPITWCYVGDKSCQ